jgi:lipopolysaccharide biosynthesis glycosyltransferase
MGPAPDAAFGMPNGGLQVVNPSKEIYDKIVSQLDTSATLDYDFADQSLLGDLFHGRWVALPYIYNALKTLRWEGVHDAIWRDESVKNVHYILSPKPWDEWADEEKETKTKDVSHIWWFKMNEERLKEEEKNGVKDQF